MKELLVFASFHYDVAYMETFEGYLPRCLEIIDAGLDILDERPDYIFNIEQVILVDAYWQRRPENRERMRGHAADRRLIFCPGMWTMPDGNIPSAESCYRNVLIGREWLQQHLGVEPGPICWMADIFGHHPQSPQIYSQLGYDLYMFERGQLEDVETVDFLWVGIDGTRLLTHWEADTYYGLHLGFAWLGNRSKEWITDRIRKTVIERIEKGTGGNLFSKIGGDFLLPSRESLQFIDTWNKEGGVPRIVFAHPREAIEGIGQRTDLPEIRADFNPLFQGTYSSRIRIKQFNRALENLAYALEALAVCLGTEAKTDALWRGIVTHQFHDIAAGSLCDRAWKEALTTCHNLRESATQEIARLLQGPGGGKILVFNPLPYPRCEVVPLAGGARLLQMEAMQVAPVEECAFVSEFDPVRAKERMLDNGLLRLEIDEYGRAARLTDLTTGIVHEDPRFGFIHDIALESDYGDLWVPHSGPVNSSLLHIAPYHDPIMPSGVQIVSRGLFGRREADSQCFNLPAIQTAVASDLCTATLSAVYGESHTVHYTLNAGEKLLRIRVEHRFGAVQQRLRALMPTGIVGGMMRREIPAGWVAQPEGEYPAQNWMDYADRDKGLCLLNRGLPGNNVTDGVMLLTLFRAVAMLEPGIAPDYERDVRQVAEYALHPFRPGDPEYQPTRLGRRFNQPVIAVSGAGCVEPRGVRVGLETAMTEIVSLRPLVNHSAIELRLHDSSGAPSRAVVKTSRPLASVTRVTPMGESLGSVAIQGEESFSLNVRPFEIATVHLRF